MMTGEFYESSKNKSTDVADRYKTCDVLVDRETGESLLATREIYDIYVGRDDIYHRLENHEVGRLDILAYNYYKNPAMWWIIAQANDIYDPFIDIEPGTLLRIPSLLTMYGNSGIIR